jgi:S-adenosylmethionine hydrolase
MRRFTALVIGLCVLASAVASGADAALAAARPARPLIVFLSDFGTLDDAVAICKGVMLTVAPNAEIIDLTHQVTPYSISEGARLLARTAVYYPPRTVFVAVIDPGVGTNRRSIVVKTRRGQFFVLPDNGLVTPLVDRDGLVAAREIRNPAWLIGGALSSTFHGRDVFSPVAAHLARGDDWTKVGPVVAMLTRVESPQAVVDERGVSGSVVAFDGPYGNLVTNVRGDLLSQLGYARGDSVHVKVGAEDLRIPYAATFGDVPVGTPLVYIDSRGLLSLAINQGDFGRVHGVTPPVELVVFRK